GTVITINGTWFKNSAGKYPIDQVTFGCYQSACPNAAKTVKPTDVSTNVSTGVSTLTVKVPDGAETGYISIKASGPATPDPVFTSTEFTVEGATFEKFPELPKAGSQNTLVIAALNSNRALVVNKLAGAISAIPNTGPGGGCEKQGCPIPPGETTATVANTIAMYAFGLVTQLVSDGDNQVIGQQLVNLVTQPNVLSFISQSVAANNALATLPPSVATLAGDAAATFVAESFGNLDVATQFAPFLKTLNLNSVTISFATELATGDANKAILGQFINTKYPKQPELAQQALLNFFQNSDVQQTFGQAFSASISEVLGLPLLGGSPDAALADYLGQVAASALLGASVTETNPLAITIGNTVENLILEIGTTVADDAGAAFVNLLKQPAAGGQAAVATTFANLIPNAYVAFLRPPTAPSPPSRSPTSPRCSKRSPPGPASRSPDW
ncbi:MAG: hypothetical protein WAO90_12535, partial [Mycobacterium sp.]